MKFGKLALFAAALAGVFGVAFAISAIVTDPAEPSEAHDHEHTTTAGAGLSATRSGYTLDAIAAPGESNRAGTLRFRVLGPDGATVTRFDTDNEKQLHLIIARSDTTQFRHVHPTMDAEGVWSIDWTWPTGGVYRVFADFTPTAGPGDLVLSRTVAVSGDAAPAAQLPPTTTAEVDGYRVRLTGRAGSDPAQALSTGGSELRFTVTKDGQPVTDLEPYLGSYGHLVALRIGDLAYLHVHPIDRVHPGGGGPDITFHAQAPNAAEYRLYLQFSVGGTVHTAAFTVAATADSTMSPMPGMPMGHTMDGGGHR